ncbi:MAG: YeeE/YedE family protein [Pseudobdellovibrionaceae bacterium]|nr:YeeE/YedE family protein [Bdellovibrionales bacterium]USN47694.1 MAG: YeeE/YedE family protein [Pseudobdellovibrionaceae bacterium]
MEWGTIIEALIGGGLIGLAVSIMLIFNGRVTGISGIFDGAITLKTIRSGDYLWRLTFLAGLIAGGVILLLFYQPAFSWDDSYNLATVAVAGFLVGFGTLMGNGCTSGHGICGVSRMSPRSIVATLSFMISGFITVYIMRHILGG